MSETLDNIAETIDNNLGKSLTPNAVFVGYVLIANSFIVFIVNPYFSIAFLLAGGLLSFTSNGVKLDPAEKKYMVYTKCYGFKIGKWKSLEKFPYICILSRQLGSTAYTRIQSITTKDLYFDVCLLTESHRQNILVKRIQDKDQAMLELGKIVLALNVEPTTYAPLISQRTMERRNRR